MPYRRTASAPPDTARSSAIRRLEAGADPNARQQGGFTALHEAALNGNVALIALLLDRGADPTAANDKGEVPIDFARTKGHAGAVALLERRDT